MALRSCHHRTEDLDLTIEHGLAHELQGTAHLDYRPDGLVCAMNIPAPSGALDG